MTQNIFSPCGKGRVPQVAGITRSNSNASESSISDVTDLVEFISLAFAGTDGTSIPEKVQELMSQFTQDMALSSHCDFRTDVFLNAQPTFATTRRISLGTHDMPNQYRLHKHSNTDWRHETRSAWKQAYADVSHPNIDDFINDATECARIAATASVLVAIFADNPVAGLAVFLPAFKVCLYQKVSQTIVDETSVTLGYTNETGCWTYHCP